jgi:integrase
MIRFSRPCSFPKGDDMKRARHQRGSVVFDKRRKIWNYLWCENGHRRTKLLGTARELPTKTAAQRAAEPFRYSIGQPSTAKNLLVAELVRQYREERMPTRIDTRRSYDVWLRNHILPKWGESSLTELQARPVELWLQSLPLSPKSKAHIRGMISILWDYAVWRGDVAMLRNPMELVTIKGVSKRQKHPKSLTVEQFQRFINNLEEPFRLMALLCCCLGLRISECLALKWRDVDWMEGKLTVERSIVCQNVDDVKTAESRKTLVIDRELLAALKAWKQTTLFSSQQDWVFASTNQAGTLPWSYDQVWRKYQAAAEAAEIGKLGTHSLRHTFRTWLDSVGTPVGVQQKLMRHADIRTTMNIYGDAVTSDMAEAHGKIVGLALKRLPTDCKPT